MSPQTNDFFQKLEESVNKYNTANKSPISLKMIHSQLFQILQIEYQGSYSGHIKKAEPQKVDELSPAEAAMLLDRIMKDAA